MNMQNAAINWTAHKIVSFLNTAMNVDHAWLRLKCLITWKHSSTRNEQHLINMWFFFCFFQSVLLNTTISKESFSILHFIT